MNIIHYSIRSFFTNEYYSIIQFASKRLFVATLCSPTCSSCQVAWWIHCLTNICPLSGVCRPGADARAAAHAAGLGPGHQPPVLRGGAQGGSLHPGNRPHSRAAQHGTAASRVMCHVSRVTCHDMCRCRWCGASTPTSRCCARWPGRGRTRSCGR